MNPSSLAIACSILDETVLAIIYTDEPVQQQNKKISYILFINNYLSNDSFYLKFNLSN